jgi:hypothetical protein
MARWVRAARARFARRRRQRQARTGTGLALRPYVAGQAADCTCERNLPIGISSLRPPPRNLAPATSGATPAPDPIAPRAPPGTRQKSLSRHARARFRYRRAPGTNPHHRRTSLLIHPRSITTARIRLFYHTTTSGLDRFSPPSRPSSQAHQ